jgi:hypothetical protein
MPSLVAVFLLGPVKQVTPALPDGLAILTL